MFKMRRWKSEDCFPSLTNTRKVVRSRRDENTIHLDWDTEIGDVWQGPFGQLILETVFSHEVRSLNYM